MTTADLHPRHGGFLVWPLIADGWFIVKMWTGLARKWEPLAARLPWVPPPHRALVAAAHAPDLDADAHHLHEPYRSRPAGIHVPRGLGMSYLSIIFLFLSVSAISKNPDALLWFWKHRVLWALGIFGATLFLGLAHAL